MLFPSTEKFKIIMKVLNMIIYFSAAYFLVKHGEVAGKNLEGILSFLTALVIVFKDIGAIIIPILQHYNSDGGND